MNKKILMLITIATLSILVSSMIVVSQAGWTPKSEYVSYDYEVKMGPFTIISVDASELPIIKIESVHDNIIELTITIDDQVYTYPDDFDLIATGYAEFNAVTGEGFSRTEGTIIFKMPGSPTLRHTVVSRLSGYETAEGGIPVNPENRKIEGEFRLSGTKRFTMVDGFGLTEGHSFPPPDFTGTQIHQFGFIKGWPF